MASAISQGFRSNKQRIFTSLPKSKSEPTLPDGTGKRVAIVASRFNPDICDRLLTGAIEALEQTGVSKEDIVIFRVPGAFEIPVTSSALLHAEEAPIVLIALGLIIRGKTQHGDLVAESVTNSLQQLACDTKIPVIHEVLLVDDEKQAYARCIGSQLNRGREAARSAHTMIELFSELGLLQDKKKKSTRSYPSNV